MALTKAKRELLDKKEAACLPFQIEKTDIISIVNTAWDKSFANAATNRVVICERGWRPLNYNALNHPEIQLTINGAADATLAVVTDRMDTVPLDNLNLTKGFSGSLINKIVEHRNREASRTGVDQEEQAQKRKETAQAKLDSKKYN